MKIRQGFVSNSSSSSFCISTDAYDSVFDVALAMIPKRDWKDQDKKLMAKIRKAKGKGGKNPIDPNTSISFPSCNYQTYIVKKGDYYLISTCNNHPFYDVLNGQSQLPTEIMDELEMPLEDRRYWSEVLESKIPELDSFWYPDYDLFASPQTAYAKDWYCKEHFCDKITPVGSEEEVCPVCLTKGKNKK